MGVGIGITFQALRLKFFYVMGKVLSSELSCKRTGLVDSACMMVVQQNLITFYSTQIAKVPAVILIEL